MVVPLGRSCCLVANLCRTTTASSLSSNAASSASQPKPRAVSTKRASRLCCSVERRSVMSRSLSNTMPAVTRLCLRQA